MELACPGSAYTAYSLTEHTALVTLDSLTLVTLDNIAAALRLYARSVKSASQLPVV